MRMFFLILLIPLLGWSQQKLVLGVQYGRVFDRSVPHDRYEFNVAYRFLRYTVGITTDVETWNYPKIRSYSGEVFSAFKANSHSVGIFAGASVFKNDKPFNLELIAGADYVYLNELENVASAIENHNSFLTFDGYYFNAGTQENVESYVEYINETFEHDTKWNFLHDIYERNIYKYRFRFNLALRPSYVWKNFELNSHFRANIYHFELSRYYSWQNLGAGILNLGRFELGIGLAYIIPLKKR